MDKSGLKHYLKLKDMTVKELSGKIGVPVRTIEGWCSGRPVPAWVDVFLRKLEFSESLSSRINFLEKFTKNIRIQLLSLRIKFRSITASYETKVFIRDQMQLLINLWVDTYPQDDFIYCDNILTEFNSILNSCQY